MRRADVVVKVVSVTDGTDKGTLPDGITSRFDHGIDAPEDGSLLDRKRRLLEELVIGKTYGWW